MSAAAARADLLDQRGEHRARFSASSVTRRAGAVRDDRAVVGAVVELRAGQHQPVEHGSPRRRPAAVVARAASSGRPPVEPCR